MVEIKSLVVKMKNVFDGLIEETLYSQGGATELEGSSRETFQNKTQGGRMKTQNGMSKAVGQFQKACPYLIGMREQEEREDRVEGIFAVLMAKNFQKLLRDI